MTSILDGNIPRSYLEGSRWLPCFNWGEEDIEPFAPCSLVSTPMNDPETDEVDESRVLYAVVPYTNRTAPNDFTSGASQLAVNGPALIRGSNNARDKSERYGSVTKDWPAIARIGDDEDKLGTLSGFPLYPEVPASGGAAKRFGKAVYSARSGFEYGLGFLSQGRQYAWHGRQSLSSMQVSVLIYKSRQLSESLAWVTHSDESSALTSQQALYTESLSLSNDGGTIPLLIGDYGWYYGLSSQLAPFAAKDGKIEFYRPGIFEIHMRCHLAGGSGSGGEGTASKNLDHSHVLLRWAFEADLGRIALPNNTTGGDTLWICRETLSPIVTGIDDSGGYNDLKLKNRDVFRSGSASIVVYVWASEDWDEARAESEEGFAAIGRIGMEYTKSGDYPVTLTRASGHMDITFDGFLPDASEEGS